MPTKHQASKLKKLLQAGEKLGLVFKFDVNNLLLHAAAQAKHEGANGKSKGLKEAAYLVSQMQPADAVKVCRCESCGYLIQDETGQKPPYCQQWRAVTKLDGYCHEAARLRKIPKIQPGKEE